MGGVLGGVKVGERVLGVGAVSLGGTLKGVLPSIISSLRFRRRRMARSVGHMLAAWEQEGAAESVTSSCL